MDGLILLLPMLFLSICVSFILVQSCFTRWKAGGIWKRKREAAKISLVNILQMTNPTLTSPWYDIDKIPKTEKEGDPTEEKSLSTKQSSKSNVNSSRADIFVFNPRNPNLLSSVITMNEQTDNVAPPCYQCCNNSTSRLSDAIILRPPSYPSLHSKCNSKKLTNSLENLIPTNTRDDECVCKYENKSFLQPSASESEPSTGRRNSSAVLYL